ncbi:hypothetical protein GCM10025871_12780 [Deinococcus metallilatus]|nr:hypothetical protein GCM10025871_12780 [Deinococcus metallilatus]
MGKLGPGPYTAADMSNMSSADPLGRPLEVRSAPITRLFSNLRNVQLLMPFMRPGGETVTGLAQKHHLTLNAAYRKVKQFEALGLVRVVAEEARPGRAVKQYVCVTRSFFIPAGQMSLAETLSESFGRYQAAMNTAFVRHAQLPPNPVGGLLLVVEEGELWLLPATPGGERWRPDVPGTAAIHHASGSLMLDYADARQLQRELVDLFDRYRDRQGTHCYLMHLFLTPLGLTHDLALPHAGYTARPLGGS